MAFNQHKLEYFAFVLLGNICRIFGLKKAYKFGKVIGLFFYYFLPIRKKTVRENLKIAFPEKSELELKNLIKKNYISFGILISEMLTIPYSSKQDIYDKFFPNKNEIKAGFESENGVIIYTAHFGNWEMGGIYAGMVVKKPVFVLAKPQSNKYVTEWLTQMREKFGNKSVMLGASVRELYSLLKKGNIVGIVGDQRGPVDGMRVKFFGNETSCYTGTAEIALKTKAKIVTTFAVRQPDYTYKIELEELKYNPSSEDIVREINQKYYSALEHTIRKNPEQWFWMHKIWKY